MTQVIRRFSEECVPRRLFTYHFTNIEAILKYGTIVPSALLSSGEGSMWFGSIEVTVREETAEYYLSEKGSLRYYVLSNDERRRVLKIISEYRRTNNLGS